MRPQRLGLRLSLMLLLSLAWLILGSAPAQAGEIASRVKPAQYQGAATRGALDLVIRSDEGAPTPPGELLLNDPAGRMSGADAAGRRYREIPDSSYRREEGSYHLHVGNAASGRYTLRVIGLQGGRYTIYMTAYDQTGARADVKFSRLMEPGVMHIFAIDYSNLAGAKIKARQIHRVQ
ncbi:MAG: hypothetical protein M1438_09095 [Deltaproteobacteria bacterium]|nr:hypothetical protein [Deltaproteobacteria bacterium]